MRGIRSFLILFLNFNLSSAPVLSQSGFEQQTVRVQLFDFLQTTYLKPAFANPELVMQFYAEKMVSYWGRKNVGLNTVLRDKHSYDSRWPVRNYLIYPETLSIEPIPSLSGAYFVNIEYEFLVRSGGKRSAGIGEARLVISRDESGSHIKIVGEDGSVIQWN